MGEVVKVNNEPIRNKFELEEIFTRVFSPLQF